jgi:tetratricopeptide (TPR) repeat protein
MKKNIFIALILKLLWIPFVFAQSPQSKSYFDKGAIAYRKSDYKNAKSFFDQAIQEESKATKRLYLDAYKYRGRTNRNLLDYEAAIRDFDVIIKARPNYPRAYRYRGYCRFLLNLYADAVDDFDQYLLIANPLREEEMEKAWFWRGQCYRFLEDNQSAISDFNKTIAHNPYFSDAFRARSECYEEMSLLNDAFEDWNTMLLLETDKAKPADFCEIILEIKQLVDLAVAANKNPEEVFALAGKMAQQCPANAYILHAEMGNMKVALNRSDEAIVLYQKALTTVPSDLLKAELYLKIGDIQVVQNKKVEALKSYELALKTDALGILKTDLNRKIADLKSEQSKNLPKIQWRVPTDRASISHENHAYINACITSAQPISNTKILINGMQSRGQAPKKDETKSCAAGITQLVDLKEGDNKIVIEVTNAAGTTISMERIIKYEKENGSQHTDNESVKPKPSEQTEQEVDGQLPVVSDKRLALVVGNSNYKTNPLKNPSNDARSMQNVLKECGFDVILVENADNKTIKNQIKTFTEQLKNYGTGLFFYAGHGIEVDGVNYLMPIDVAGELNKSDVENECIKTDWIQQRMVESGGDGKCHILILDACRNNPFVNRSRGAQEIWSAPKNIPSGVITCYATSQGATAADGAGSNGLYTSMLLKHIKTKGLTIEQVFKRVRVDLKKQGGQEPIESTKLTQDFYFLKK